MSDTLSIPSKKIPILSLPEVENFVGTFIYNFFITDESVNETGVSDTKSKTLLNTRAESFDVDFVSTINRTTPKYVTLKWKPTFSGEHHYLAENISIKENISKVHFEESFSGEDFTSLLFQDSGIDGKISLFVQEAVEQLLTNDNKSGTVLELAQKLNARTSDEITGTFLADVLSNLKRLGVQFTRDINKKDISQNVLEELKTVSTKIQCNNKFIKTLLHSAEQDGAGMFSDEASAMIPHVDSIQTSAISSRNSATINGRDYDLEILDYLSYRRVDPSGFVPIFQIIGYLIEKEEVLPDGTVVKKDNIIIENPLIATTIDLKVRYGATYNYSIRSVGYMEFQAEEHEVNSILAVSFLASSKKTKIQVKTVEEIAPPPPGDFTVHWDYGHKAARLMWNFPTNTQRDIKKFQVFRRNSIKEPFELIKMFDFDDSILRSPYYETPDKSLIELCTSPKTVYIDKEFTKNSKCIYTVCSIDAHGLSSNYGMQFEVWFDKFKNKMEKKLISTSGAPKSYPNMYLQADTFVDTIKDSGHQRLSVYFDPEYLKVVNDKGHDLGLIKTNIQGAKYRLQLINTDLQTQKTIDITIVDKRDSSVRNI